MKYLYCCVLFFILCGTWGCRKSPSHRHNSQQMEYEPIKSIADREKFQEDNNSSNDYVRQIVCDVSSISNIEKIKLPAICDNKGYMLLNRRGYTILYDVKNKIPHWVAW